MCDRKHARHVENKNGPQVFITKVTVSAGGFGTFFNANAAWSILVHLRMGLLTGETGWTELAVRPHRPIYCVSGQMRLGMSHTYPVCDSRTRPRNKITPEPKWPFSPLDLESSTQLAFPLCQDQLLAKVTA